LLQVFEVKKLWRNQQSKMFCCEGTPGMRFEIFFKGNCLFATTKGNRSLDSPWAKLGCVRNLSGILGLKTGLKILGKPGIITSYVGIAD
jgi:hypothetical protein